jgi:hypothetical protein
MATAMLESGVPEGEAIATAIKHAKSHAGKKLGGAIHKAMK